MSVDLVPEWTIGDLCLTSYPFGVDADSTVDIGEPEMVVESVTSMLADGDLERVARHGNRTYVLEVYVEGPSLAEVANSEALLRTELRRTGLTLTHDPGDGFSPASVYEVQTAQLTPQRRDDHESHLIRKFTLTLTCSPFARSVDQTVVTSLSAGGSPSVSVIDTCDSATGWSATRGGSTATATTFWEAGAVGVMDLDSAVTSPEAWTLTRTGSVSFASMSYLVAEIRTVSTNGDLGFYGRTAAGEVVSLPILSRRNLVVGGGGNTYHEVTCLVPGGVTLASVTFTHTSRAGDVWQGISVRKLSQTNMPPGSSARQLSRIIDVGGTERTPASLKAFTASGYLGHTLLHTTPYAGTGYTPDLKRWRVSGNATSTNASLRKISGTWEALQPNSVVAEVPADQFPRGDYILVAAIKSSQIGERAVSWAIKSVQVNDVVVGNTTGVAHYAFEVADRLEYVPLGVVSAPSVRSNGALTVQVHLSNPSPGTTDLHVEEWWMFKDGPDSALSIVGTDEANLIIESPDSTSGVPRVWVGTGDARFHPNGRLIAQGSHTFPPGLMQVNTISDANDYLQVELSYYKRWHSNAAE